VHGSAMSGTQMMMTEHEQKHGVVVAVVQATQSIAPARQFMVEDLDEDEDAEQIIRPENTLMPSSKPKKSS